MRDEYTGDIGDFANYGLLRALCGKPENPVPGLRLGIIWYKNQIEGRQNRDERREGHTIGYLKPSNVNDETFKVCDEELYTLLQRLVGQSMARNECLQIRDVIRSQVLRYDTQHYLEPLPDASSKKNRAKWFDAAMRSTAGSDVIFLNPDIGMRWDHNGRQPEYAYHREMRALLKAGKVLVIYQHSQQRTYPNWIARNTQKLDTVRLGEGNVRVCRWGREQVRAYFIVTPNRRQCVMINARLAALENTPWVATRSFEVI